MLPYNDDKIPFLYTVRGKAQYKLNNVEQAENDWKFAARKGEKEAVEILKARGISW